MSRRNLFTLALAACLVLAVGLLVRQRLYRADTSAAAAPPSEASTLQQLTQEGQLHRMSAYLGERVAAVAPLVEYRPDARAASVRWGGDTLVSTLPGRPVVALRGTAATADSARPTITIAPDSVRRGWVLVVGRRANGQVISATGISGGRTPGRCGERDIEEYVLGLPLPDYFAGAGLFDVAGRTLGVVIRCGPDRLTAIPAREVTRLLLADRGAAPRNAFGLLVTPLDERARTLFGTDSGLLVTEIRRGGPADAAGLLPGDIITALDGQRVTSAGDIAPLGATVQPAEGHAVVRWRGRALGTVRLLPRPMPATTEPERGADAGISVAPPASARGVEITSVRAGSAAESAGLRPGDRLLRVNDAPVTSLAIAQRLLTNPRTGPLFIIFERDSVDRGVLVPR